MRRLKPASQRRAFPARLSVIMWDRVRGRTHRCDAVRAAADLGEDRPSLQRGGHVFAGTTPPIDQRVDARPGGDAARR